MSLSPTQLFAVLTPTQQLSATLHEVGPAGPPGPPGPPGADGLPHIIQDEGVALATFDTLNFAGAGVTASVDTPGARITVTIPGGSQTPWTSDIDAATFKLSNTGNVGIKIASGSDALDVNGNIRLRFTPGAGAGVWLDGASTMNAFVGMEGNSNVWRVYSSVTGGNVLSVLAGGDLRTGHHDRAAEISVPADGAADSGALVFSTRSLGTLAERVRIKANGNLGVGQSDPTARLTVAGSGVQSEGIQIAPTGLDGAVFGYSIWRRSADGMLEVRGNQTTVGGFVFSAGSTGVERLKIAADGNIGTGRPPGSYKFDVAGNCNVQSQLSFDQTTGDKILLYPPNYGLGLYSSELRIFTSDTGKVSFGGQTAGGVFTEAANVNNNGDLNITGSYRVNGAKVNDKGQNYIASETGAANALVATLTGATLAAGLEIRLLLAHTLQAGANTLNLNGAGVKNIRSHRNPANNIAAAYTTACIVCLMYDGTQWQDMSQ